MNIPNRSQNQSLYSAERNEQNIFLMKRDNMKETQGFMKYVLKMKNQLLLISRRLKQVKKEHQEIIQDEASSHVKHFQRDQQLIQWFRTRTLTRINERSISRREVWLSLVKQFTSLKESITQKESVQSIVNIYHKTTLKCSEIIPIFQPNQMISKFESSITIIIQFFYIIVIPLQISFDNEILTKKLLPINIAGQIIFFFHILFNFTKATFKDGLLLENRTQIFENRMKGGFQLELLSIFSLIFSTSANFNSYQNGFGFVWLIFLLQIGPIIQSRNILYEKYINNKFRYHLITLASLIFQILYCEHIFACLFHYLSYSLNQASGLIQIFYFQVENTFYSKYLSDQPWAHRYLETAYYTATTMITVGYGDLSPQHPSEKILCIFFMLFSCIQLSYSVGTIQTIISQLNEQFEQDESRLSQITHYMVQKNISPDLRINIREYLKYYWKEQEQEKNLIQQQQIINELPENLKHLFYKEMNTKFIEKCPLFQKFDLSSNDLDQISTIVIQLKLLPKQKLDYVLKEQNIPESCLCYIEKGEIHQMVKTGKRMITINTFVEGDFFGYDEFINSEGTKESLISKGFVRLQLVPREQFLAILPLEKKEVTQFNHFSQIFNMIHDDLLFLGVRPNQVFCDACMNSDHTISNCQYLHFLADKEKIIKKLCFTTPQTRSKNKNEKRNNPIRFQLSNVQIRCVAFQHYNQKYLQNAYEILPMSKKKFKKDIRKQRQSTFINKFKLELGKKIFNIDEPKLVMFEELESIENEYTNKIEQNLSEQKEQVQKNEILQQFEINNKALSEQLFQFLTQQNKQLYTQLMVDFLSLKDINAFKQLKFRLLKLNGQENQINLDFDFDFAREFQKYKPNDNYQLVIKRLNKFKNCQQTNPIIKQLQNYMIYPYEYLQFKKSNQESNLIGRNIIQEEKQTGRNYKNVKQSIDQNIQSKLIKHVRMVSCK